MMLGLRLGVYIEERWYQGAHRVAGVRNSRRRRRRDPAILDEGCGRLVAHKKFLARQKSVVSPWKRSPGRAAITLDEELPITPTWRANCQMVRSGQPKGCQSLWICSVGRSGAKNAMIMLA
jgi:hypothetical protein